MRTRVQGHTDVELFFNIVNLEEKLEVWVSAHSVSLPWSYFAWHLMYEADVDLVRCALSLSLSGKASDFKIFFPIMKNIYLFRASF